MKRLYKSREHKVIDGVCGGIAEYFEIDPVLIRLLAVLSIVTGGVGVIAYIVAMIIMPQRPWDYTIPNPPDAASDPAANPATGSVPPFPPIPSENRSGTGTLIVGVVLILFGFHFLLRNMFYPIYWWLWNEVWKYFWPTVLIAVGLLILFRSTKRS